MAPDTSIAAQLPEATRWGQRATRLLCRAGGVLCAIPIEQVSEVMRPLAIERIAGSPSYVLGVSIIRGVPVPVADLGLIVGERAAGCTRFINVRMAAHSVALAVQAVLGISAVAPETLGDLPPLLRDAAPEAVAGIGALDDELIVFLRSARFIPEAVLERIYAKAVGS